MKKKSAECSVAVGSITAALRAQSVLAVAAVPSTVIKSDSSSSRHGCVYGISFSCLQENNVRSILSKARIQIKQWDQQTTDYDISR